MLKKNDNNYLIYIILMIPMILVPPLLFMTITAFFCLRKRKFNLYVSFFAALVVTIGCFLIPSLFLALVADLETVFGGLVFQAGTSINIFGIIGSTFKYSLSSYFLFGLMGLSLASLLLLFSDRKALALKSLDETMADVEEKNDQITEDDMDLREKTVIGSAYGRTITIDDNARHVMVCGTTGSGKTVALANFVESGAKKGYPMLIVDGKGDFGKGSLYDIVKYFKGNRPLYVVNMSDPLHSQHYNPFQTVNASVCKDMLVNMTTWSEEHYKANTERYLQRMIQVLLKAGVKLSFQSIIKALDPVVLSKVSMNALAEGVVTKAEHKETLEIIKAGAEIANAAAARFATMAESECGAIFEESGISIPEAIAQNAIILFILNPLLYPELAPALGRLILIDAKQAIAQLYQNNKKHVFFLFDEIQSYATTALIDLVNKARSANVSCILATQSLADLDAQVSPAYREQIIENCNNYIVMRQNSAKSAEAWAEILGTKDSMAMTYQLGEQNKQVTGTGYGSVRRVKEFLYHPDVIKRLGMGKAIYLSKDNNNKHALIDVRKGF